MILIYMWKRISCIKQFKKLIIRMEADKSTRKTLQKNKKLLEDLLKRRFVYFQGFEIYGGCAGLYDFGPVGCAIKNNLESLWRDHFVLEEDMLEVNTTCITPHIVLLNSGHVQRFTDLIVRDSKTSQGYRADKLLSQWIETKITKDKAKLKEEQVKELNHILSQVDGYNKEEISAIFKKLQIKAPDTNNELTEPEPFNLMFKTEIGPTGNCVGYLRPETAQGMFVNFSKLLQYTGGRLPFAAAQIGLGFRNEIAPRNQLIRVREFQMAQIEHFVDPNNKSHIKFKKYASLKLPLFGRQHQIEQKEPEWIEIGEAVATKLVDNETLGYFLARIFLFLKESGVNVTDHVRFRQHLKNEMAHYAKDCWDAEIETSAGWIECVGCADRSAFDLTHHSEGSGVKLVAARRFKQPRPEQQTTIAVNKQVVGKQFKKDSQAINAHLEKLQENLKAELMKKFTQTGEIVLQINGNKFVLNKNHLEFEQKIVNVMQQKFTPSVIEPSFGLGRILTAIFQHSFQIRDQKRTYLCLKPRIAPVKVSILPLQNDERFVPIIDQIRQKCKRSGVSCKVDDSGQSIGKRYSRTDEIGIPFGITVDYKTIEDQTITLRELFTMKQIRLPISDIEKIVCGLALQNITWSDVCKMYTAVQVKEEDV